MIFSRGKILYQSLSNSLMFIFVHWLKVVIFLEVHKVLFFFFFSNKFSNFIDLSLAFKRTTNIISMILGNTVMHFQSLRILCPLIYGFESFLYSSTSFAREQTISCLSIEVLCWAKEIIFPVLDWREPSKVFTPGETDYKVPNQVKLWQALVRGRILASQGNHLKCPLFLILIKMIGAAVCY